MEKKHTVKVPLKTYTKIKSDDQLSDEIKKLYTELESAINSESSCIKCGQTFNKTDRPDWNLTDCRIECDDRNKTCLVCNSVHTGEFSICDGCIGKYEIVGEDRNHPERLTIDQINKVRFARVPKIVMNSLRDKIHRFGRFERIYAVCPNCGSTENIICAGSSKNHKSDRCRCLDCDHTWVKTVNDIIHIVYHDPEMPKIVAVDGKSDWFDLRAADTIEMKAGEYRLISLGVSMKLPEGYEAYVVPRSSTFKQFGLLQTNSMGIIDSSFSGTNDIWRFPALAMRDTTINKYDRICQFRIQKKQPSVLFAEVSQLDDTDRGGFGSTGRN